MPSSAPLPAIEASPRLGLWVGEGRGSVLPTAGLVRLLALKVQDPFPIQVAEDPCVGGGTHTSTHTPPPALHGQSPPQSRLILGPGGWGCYLHLCLGVGVGQALGVLESGATQLVQDLGPLRPPACCLVPPPTCLSVWPVSASVWATRQSHRFRLETPPASEGREGSSLHPPAPAHSGVQGAPCCPPSSAPITETGSQGTGFLDLGSVGRGCQVCDTAYLWLWKGLLGGSTRRR